MVFLLLRAEELEIMFGKSEHVLKDYGIKISMYQGVFNFKNFGFSKKRGVPLKVLENYIWKTGFRFSLS